MASTSLGKLGAERSLPARLSAGEYALDPTVFLSALGSMAPLTPEHAESDGRSARLLLGSTPFPPMKTERETIC